MLKQIKNYLLNDSKSYVVKSTRLERPRLFLVGMLYILAVFVILIIAVEFLDLGDVLAPLALLEPVTRFFIDVETHEPRNILGLIYLLVIFLGILVAFVGLILPGVYVAVRSSTLLDKEWPDDPDKTQQWREKHADK